MKTRYLFLLSVFFISFTFYSCEQNSTSCLPAVEFDCDIDDNEVYENKSDILSTSVTVQVTACSSEFSEEAKVYKVDSNGSSINDSESTIKAGKTKTIHYTVDPGEQIWLDCNDGTTKCKVVVCIN